MPFVCATCLALGFPSIVMTTVRTHRWKQCSYPSGVRVGSFLEVSEQVEKEKRQTRKSREWVFWCRFTRARGTSATRGMEATKLRDAAARIPSRRRTLVCLFFFLCFGPAPSRNRSATRSARVVLLRSSHLFRQTRSVCPVHTAVVHGGRGATWGDFLRPDSPSASPSAPVK